MIKPRIVVTGATGKTGRTVVSELLEADYPVPALVHREDCRSAQLKSQGAEIVVADLSAVERVRDALGNVQRAYYCPPIDPYAIHGVRYATRPVNRRTLSHWLRAFAQFMITPLVPGFNLDRYDREIRRPFPSVAHFSGESAVWQDQHNLGGAASPRAAARSRTGPMVSVLPQSKSFPGESR